MNTRGFGARVRLVIVCLTVLVGVAWTKPACAYAWMIRHDYDACAQCHADPSGGGLLTPYGRAQGELLLRTRWGVAADDPGPVAGFLFGAITPPDQLLLGGDVRALAIDQMVQSSPPVTDFFLMQADLTGQLTVDRFRANASIGYAQEGALRAAITTAPEKNIVSRVHWLGLDLGEDKEWLLRVGRMNLPFGIRSIEHPLWIRSETRTDINDEQQHGVSLATTSEHWRGEIMAIAGNFQVAPSAYRERGGSGFVEWDPSPGFAAGASALITYADLDLTLQTPLLRHAYGPFARFSPVEPLVLLAEADVLVNSQPHTLTEAAFTRVGYVGALEADVEPIQGVHLAATGEILNEEPSREGPSLGAWGTVHWFFMPHADLRADAIYRSLASSTSTTGSTTLLAQLHLYL